MQLTGPGLRPLKCLAWDYSSCMGFSRILYRPWHPTYIVSGCRDTKAALLAGNEGLRVLSLGWALVVFVSWRRISQEPRAQELLTRAAGVDKLYPAIVAVGNSTRNGPKEG